jgi:dipeptidyl aminopeptidase/acylaminoacyl peptidase
MICATRGLVVLAIFCSALQLPQPAAAAEQKRHITEEDLFRFTWAADPQISPDGTRVVFVKVTVNKEKDAYETSLWMVPTEGGEMQRLTNGPQDTGPRWSPDGSCLVFTRSAEKEGKPDAPQLYLLSFSGGEPRALTSLPKGAGQAAWSPDGKKLAFISTTTPDDLAKAERAAKDKEAKEKKKEHESDVRVITKAVYRMNGPGYFNPKQSAHIWKLDIPASVDGTAKPKQLTSGEFNEGEPTWCADGSRIYFTSVRIAEPYYELRQNEIYSVPADGGPLVKVAGIQGSVGNPSLSQDGKHIAVRGVLSKPVHSYTPPDLFVVETTPGAVPRNLTASYEYDVGSGLTGDQHPPRGGGFSPPLWNRDGTAVIDKVAQEGKANLSLFDVGSGKITALTRGDQEVISFSASADRSKLALLISTPTNIGDIFLCDSNGGSLKQLTHINQKLFSELDLTPPEMVSYASFDGKKIQAWVQKPPGFDPQKKYPLILNIHGGPHAAYGYTFDHEFQWMAAKGYVVLYPNPRGSSSYGEEFGNIIQYHYPGDDYKDLMAGVDELIRRGYVDPQRLGVTGGSGGGLLTNWVITQTDRFAAAASQRSIADWTAWWYSADFTLFQPNWFRAAPFQDPGDYATRSPITYVQRVKTPLMLIEGEADYRTPPGSGGETMFRALKFLKKPVVMVRFPGESHELSRSGKPWHRVERLQHIVNWFDKYLQGKPMPQYDVHMETRAASTQEDRSRY